MTHTPKDFPVVGDRHSEYQRYGDFANYRWLIDFGGYPEAVLKELMKRKMILPHLASQRRIDEKPSTRSRLYWIPGVQMAIVNWMIPPEIRETELFKHILVNPFAFAKLDLENIDQLFNSDASTDIDRIDFDAAKAAREAAAQAQEEQNEQPNEESEP